MIQGYFQEVGQQAAAGEVDIELLESLKLSSPEAKEAFALGTLGGLGFQTTGAMAKKLTTKDETAIIQEMIDNITPEEAESEEKKPSEAPKAEPTPDVEAKPTPEADPKGPTGAAEVVGEPAPVTPTEKPPEVPPVAAEAQPAKKPQKPVSTPAKPEIGPEIAAEKQKQPWQLTQKEWVDGKVKSPAMHREHVEQALNKGFTVPPEVLKDYPDLEKSLQAAPPPLKVGDPIKIHGTEMLLVDQQRIEGADYEIFSGAKLKEGKAAVRVYDADSGEVVSLVTYPDFDMAETKFKEAIKIAAIVAEETAVPKPAPMSEVVTEPFEMQVQEAAKVRAPTEQADLGLGVQRIAPKTGIRAPKGAPPPEQGAPLFEAVKAQRITEAQKRQMGIPAKELSIAQQEAARRQSQQLRSLTVINPKDLSQLPAVQAIMGVNATKDYPGLFEDVRIGRRSRSAVGAARLMSRDTSQKQDYDILDEGALPAEFYERYGRYKDFDDLVELAREEIQNYADTGKPSDLFPSPEDVKLYSMTGPIDPELVKATIREVESFAGSVVRTVKRVVRRGTTHMRKLGEGGKELAADIDEIAFNVQREANNDTQDIQKIMKGLTGKERIAVAMVTDNEISAESQSDQIIKRSEQLRKVLDRQLEEFGKVGGLRRLGGPGAKKETPIGVGHAFPQVPNKEGRQVLKEVAAGSMNPWWAMSPRVSKAVEWMVEKGLAKNADAAVQQLARFRDQQLRSVNPYFERTRNPLPSYLREWDPHKVLSGAMERNWLTIEGIRKWGWDETGKSFPGASELIGKISLENPYDAEIVHQFIQSSFGLGSRASEENQRISRDLRAVQFIGKIALSPLTITRNMIDRFAKAYTTAGLSTTVRATMKFPPVVNVWIKSAERIKDQMIRSGAVFSHGSIAEGIEPATIIMRMVGQPFSSSERGNQIFEALVAKIKIERDINLYLEAKPKSRLGKLFKAIQILGENTESEIAERIKEAGLADKTTEEMVNILAESTGGDLLPIEIQAVLHRASRDQAFPVILSTKRLWWDNQPFMKVLSQFKIWPIEQIGFIYRSAMVQSIRGNIAPLLRFIIGVIIAGELYNIFRDAVYDKEESLLTTLRKRPDKHNAKDISWILLKDAIDGGLVGMFADLTWGLTDWVLGPTAATIGELGKTLVSAIRRPGLTLHALRRAVRRDVSMTRQAEGILNKIGVWIGRDSKRAVLYNRWRFRANEYWRQQNVDIFEKIEKTILGPPSYPVGKNSLIYDLVARSITAKDIAGAAEYIRILFDEKDTPKERRQTWTNLRQSRTRRSPLGPVARTSRIEFLDRFSEEDQQEARALQREWVTDYNKAMIISRKSGVVSD